MTNDKTKDTPPKQGETREITKKNTELKGDVVINKSTASSVLTMMNSKPTRVFFKDGKAVKDEVAK